MVLSLNIVMIILARFFLALISSSCHASSHNNIHDNSIPLHNASISTRVISSLPSPAQTHHLMRRIIHDGSCRPPELEFLMPIMERVEIMSLWAANGAALRRGTRSGRGGRGRGRGSGRGTFSESLFEINFAQDQQSQTNVGLTARSAVRRRFLAVAEQASRIGDPNDRETQEDQVFHCEHEGDPGGICYIGGYIRLLLDRPYWNVIVSTRNFDVPIDDFMVHFGF